jgi:protein-L-isoaspartate(D-aspartate) O-methyltransferase
MAGTSWGGERLIGALEAAGIRDPHVLSAFSRVARERFVPPGSEPEARTDHPVPIGQGQVTTQPSLIARMLEALALDGGERVLEIGTGYGYQTALLVELGAEVHSVERFDALARAARRNLDVAGYRAAEIVVGDGTLGHEVHAPFQAVVVSAAAPAVPRPLAEQLAEGGRLVMPIGPGGEDEVIAFRKHHGRLRQIERLCHAYFVPLIGRHGVVAR